MIRTAFKLCVVLSIVSPSLAESNARRYDLEQESWKLYGQDFETVLKRFRRTPDYLKILEKKLGQMKLSVKEMAIQILHYTHGKMKERVEKILPTTLRTTKTDDFEEKQTVFFHAQDIRRQIYEQLADSETPENALGDGSENKVQEQKLDNYTVFASKLSVDERNSMVDLGFELAGSVIHTLLEHMGVPKSDVHTAAPEEPGAKVTTAHPKQHEVHHESTNGVEPETEPETQPPNIESRALFTVTTTSKPLGPSILREVAPASTQHPVATEHPVEVPTQRARLDEFDPEISTLYIE